jgi:hypothetical protein
MKKIKLWFVYEPVTIKGKLSHLTKRVINLITKLEKYFDKKMFDLRSIHYERFISESKIKINKEDLPVVLINEKTILTKRLPSVGELKQRITKLMQKGTR